MKTDPCLSRKSKSVFNISNPFRLNQYSHVNPWHAAMANFTDQIERAEQTASQRHRAEEQAPRPRLQAL